MPSPEYVPLQGSERQPIPDVHPDAVLAGDVDPNQRIEVTVVLRPRSSVDVQRALENASRPGLGERTYVSREELVALRAADPDDLAAVMDWAEQQGLTVVDASIEKRAVVLSGTVADMTAAFRVPLHLYHLESGSYRGRSGPIHVPVELAPIILSVDGLDNRLQSRPRFVAVDDLQSEAAAQGAGASYSPPEVAALYNFPVGVDGSDVCIGILEFGGGFNVTDLQNYFASLEIPMPQVSVVSVDHAQNHPTGNPNSADGEVMLDIEVAGAIAPGATIVVYFAPNTAQGFIDAITTAVHDATNNPSIISISWGGPEAHWTPQTMRAMDQAFQDAVALGISVFCASGDNGSSDGIPVGNHVDFPASSPHVAGCGGTALESSGSTITSEVVWSGSGGGVSAFFPLPPWQSGAHVPSPPNPRGGRGVPDVAGDASPSTGYQVTVDGQELVFGGTSAVAPLWAGLTALINQYLNARVGFANSLLYGLPATARTFHDITVGNNGAYRAGPGWDACTGLGSPDGANLARSL